MKPELKPCPFCGGTPMVFRSGDSRQSHIITCSDCGCTLESNEEGDIRGTAWNCRAIPSKVSLPSCDIEESLKQLEVLMHRVSKAAITVGYGNESGELMLKNAEDMFMETARKLLTNCKHNLDEYKLVPIEPTYEMLEAVCTGDKSQEPKEPT